MTDYGPAVLAVTSEPPWPLNSGGHIRTFHLLKALAAETLLQAVIPVRSEEVETAQALHDYAVNLSLVEVGPRTRGTEARRLLGAAVRREPYVMYRRHARPEVRRRLAEHRRAGPRPDVLYLDHLDSFLYRRQFPGVPAVLDLHNVYSLLARRTADEQHNPLKRLFLRREARLLDEMELRAVRDCDAVFAVSEPEAAHFRRLGAKAVHVVPNGVDCAAVADLPTGRTGPPVVLFLGTMSWGPNAAAARFLAAEVMSQLRQRVPDARLVVVGRDPPADLKSDAAAGVEVTGGVPDVRPYLRQASVMTVPLDAGGGTRLKILEAFAAGLPVASTAVGAEGIDATPGTHFVRAERPDFARAVAELLTAPEASARMAAAGRQLARDRYDWAGIGRRAAAIVKDLAASTSGVGRGTRTSPSR